MEKERRLQDQAKQDRDEFQRVIHEQKRDRDVDLKLEQEKNEMVKKHADELKKQIALNNEKKKQEKRNLLEEGKKVKDKLKTQQKVLEEMKSKKIEELRGTNIPQKYTMDLQKKKINV